MDGQKDKINGLKKQEVERDIQHRQVEIDSQIKERKERKKVMNGQIQDK